MILNFRLGWISRRSCQEILFGFEYANSQGSAIHNLLKTRNPNLCKRERFFFANHGTRSLNTPICFAGSLAFECGQNIMLIVRHPQFTRFLISPSQRSFRLPQSCNVWRDASTPDIQIGFGETTTVRLDVVVHFRQGRPAAYPAWQSSSKISMAADMAPIRCFVVGVLWDGKLLVCLQRSLDPCPPQKGMRTMLTAALAGA